MSERDTEPLNSPPQQMSEEQENLNGSPTAAVKPPQADPSPDGRSGVDADYNKNSEVVYDDDDDEAVNSPSQQPAEEQENFNGSPTEAVEPPQADPSSDGRSVVVANYYTICVVDDDDEMNSPYQQPAEEQENLNGSPTAAVEPPQADSAPDGRSEFVKDFYDYGDVFYNNGVTMKSLYVQLIEEQVNLNGSPTEAVEPPQADSSPVAQSRFVEDLNDCGEAVELNFLRPRRSPPQAIPLCSSYELYDDPIYQAGPSRRNDTQRSVPYDPILRNTAARSDPDPGANTAGRRGNRRNVARRGRKTGWRRPS